MSLLLSLSLSGFVLALRSPLLRRLRDLEHFDLEDERRVGLDCKQRAQLRKPTLMMHTTLGPRSCSFGEKDIPRPESRRRRRRSRECR
jgi:hypothetical protein